MNILITGASRGIGAAAYALLKSRGHNVVGHSTLGSADLVAGDLARSEAPRETWTEALHRLNGRIDALVNNAGVYEPLPASTNDDWQWESEWERTMTINLRAATALCRFAVMQFRNQGGGRIVNVSSRAGYRGDSPDHWHYAASKAGMIGMTKTIARGYAKDGVLAFAVTPGFTVSEMTEEYLQGRGGAQVVADIPLGRVATPDEVAEVIRWLATEAPPSSTGSVVDVNGASYVR